MTHRSIARPAIIGALMGAMMLWMVHGLLTGQSDLAGAALVGFIAVHLLVIAAVLGAGWGVSRFAPGLRRHLDRLHRPSLRHVSVMMGAAMSVAVCTHYVVHGGF